MADYFATETGAGLQDGTSIANAWDIHLVDWDGAVAGNTLYVVGTVRGFVVDASPSSGTTTIRGDYPGNAGTVDGAATDDSLLRFTSGQHDYIISGLTFTNVQVLNVADAIRIFDSYNIVVDGCTFQNTELGRGVYIGCPNASSLVRDITIRNNTFQNWNDRDPASSENACIIMLSNTADGNYPTDIKIHNNIARDSNMFYRNLVTGVDGDAVAAGEYWVRGLQIYENTIERCERAIQQVHWYDGDGVKKSFIRNNTIRDTGSGGISGTVQMNVIQLARCVGGDVSGNLIDGWEKIEGSGDGCAIILDWWNSDPNYHTVDVDVFQNTIRNGLTEQQGEYTLGGINFYRAENCSAYSNLIYDTRCAFTVANGSIPANGQGNIIYNNTVVNTAAEAIRFGTDAEVATFRNNLFIDCEVLYTASGTAASPDWDYNCYYDCGTPPATGANDLQRAPRVTGPDEYKPYDNSPLLGAGVAALLPIADINNEQQPNPPHIGAYATSQRLTQGPSENVDMSVHTTAGATLAISASLPSSYTISGYSSLSYTNIGQITNLAEFGRQYNLVTHNPIADRRTIKRKGSFNDGALNLEMARLASDTGQSIVQSAANADTDYTFKVTHQTGEVQYFVGQVFSYTTNLQSVDNITTANVQIEINRDILGITSGVPTYRMDGVDQYLQIPSYESVGMPIYTALSYNTDNEDGYIEPTSEPFTDIGKVGANYHDGTLRSVSVKDTCPIVKDGDRSYLNGIGDGSGGSGTQQITVTERVFTGSFRISLDWLRKDRVTAGTSVSQGIIGRTAPVDRIDFNDSQNGATPNQINVFQAGAGRFFPNALEDVDQDKWCHIVIESIKTWNNRIWRCWVDGVLKGENTVANTSDWGYDRFMSKDAGNNGLRAGSAIANLKFEDLQDITGLFTVFYPLDEGSGTVANAYDKYGADYNSRDGTIQSTPEWLTVTDPSRKYDMDEGTGTSIADSLGGAAATIVNGEESGWETEPVYTITSLPTVPLTNILSYSTIWNIVKHPSANYAYVAAGADGIYVLNTSNPAAPTHIATVRFKDVGGADITQYATDILIDDTNDVLYICGRSITWGVGALPGTIAAYDIAGANAALPVWSCSYSPPSMSPQPNGASGLSNAWFQGMAIHESLDYMIVATQRFGVYCLDLTNVKGGTPDFTVADTYDWMDLLEDFANYRGRHDGGNGVTVLSDSGESWGVDDLVDAQLWNTTTICSTRVSANTATTVTGGQAGFNETGTLNWDTNDEYVILHNITFDWETSQCCYHDGRGYFATHGNGIISLAVSATGQLTDARLHGNYQAPIIGGGGDRQLRARDVVTDGKFIYVAPNCTAITDAPERGVLTQYIGAPGMAIPGFQDWGHAPIGVDDNHTHDGTGDEPFLGGVKYGNHYLMGGDGLYVFDVSDPLNPAYVGLMGSPAGYVLAYSACVFEESGTIYVYYGDAPENPQKHNLYVGTINKE